jgi:hypothetical protein
MSEVFSRGFGNKLGFVDWERLAIMKEREVRIDPAALPEDEANQSVWLAQMSSQKRPPLSSQNVGHWSAVLGILFRDPRIGPCSTTWPLHNSSPCMRVTCTQTPADALKNWALQLNVWRVGLLHWQPAPEPRGQGSDWACAADELNKKNAKVRAIAQTNLFKLSLID